jgi:hypothetical protein
MFAQGSRIVGIVLTWQPAHFATVLAGHANTFVAARQSVRGFLVVPALP